MNDLTIKYIKNKIKHNRVQYPRVPAQQPELGFAYSLIVRVRENSFQLEQVDVWVGEHRLAPAECAEAFEKERQRAYLYVDMLPPKSWVHAGVVMDAEASITVDVFELGVIK